jgi:hypothetical protein
MALPSPPLVRASITAKDNQHKQTLKGNQSTVHTASGAVAIMHTTHLLPQSKNGTETRHQQYNLRLPADAHSLHLHAVVAQRWR